MYFAYVNGNELKAFYGMDFMAVTCQCEQIWEWHVLSHSQCNEVLKAGIQVLKKNVYVGS